MNAYAKVAIATVAVIAVVGFGVAPRQPDITTSGEPDAGWLEAGPQLGLPLVGPIWTEEAEFSGDATSSAPDGGGIVIVASLEFTADGRVVVDTGCSTGGGAVTLEPGALRISDLRLSEPACHRIRYRRVRCTDAGCPLSERVHLHHRIGGTRALGRPRHTPASRRLRRPAWLTIATRRAADRLPGPPRDPTARTPRSARTCP